MSAPRTNKGEVFRVMVLAKIHHGSSVFRLERKGDVLHVWLTEPAEGGKANRQLVKELSRIFGSCRIVRGARSGTKTLDLPVSSLEVCMNKVAWKACHGIL